MHEDHGSALALGAVGEENDVPILLARAAYFAVSYVCRVFPHHQKHWVLDVVPLQTLAKTLLRLHHHPLRVHVALSLAPVFPLVEGCKSQVSDRVLGLLRLRNDRRPHLLDFRLVYHELCERAVRVLHDVGHSYVLDLQLFARVCHGLALGFVIGFRLVCQIQLLYECFKVRHLA